MSHEHRHIYPESDYTLPEQVQEAPTLKLGELCHRLGFNVTSDFLNSLGFAPAATDKAAKLYRERDFPSICAAIARRVTSAARGEIAPAASMAPQAPMRGVPEGFTIAPKIPTEEMLRAALSFREVDANDEIRDPLVQQYDRVYRAMLAAVPLPAAPVQQEPKP